MPGETDYSAMVQRALAASHGVTPSRATPMDRPSLGPIPERPQFLQRSGNFNRRPDMTAPRPTGGLANILLQAMSPQGLAIPPQ